LRFSRRFAVTAKDFEKTLQTYQKRKPFRSYRVRFVDGEYIDVDHPEALVLRGTVAVFFAADNTPTLFDHEGVSAVIGKTNGRKKAAS
jgi:hypothetical protein